MANLWLRLWHDMPNDPKWRTIAKVSGESISSVMAVYLHVIVNASNATERGRTHSFTFEDVASALDMEVSQIEKIIESMQGRVLEGDVVLGWDRRQPIREDGAAERAKAWRESKKEPPNATERTPNATERQDKDKDKDIKAPVVPIGDMAAIVSAYHDHCPMMPAVSKMTDNRKRKLKARWFEDPKRQTVDYWSRFFAYVAKSDFLTGRDRAGWTGCDFEWLIEPANHVKVIEGKYENREAKA
jgi:hypothetical protein